MSFRTAARLTVVVAVALPAASVHAQARAAVPTPAEMGRSVAPLVDAVKDSVVTIRSIKVIARASREDPFSRFFREQLGMGGNTAPAPPRRAQQGLGSGFIVDPKGIIFTNNHVVAGATEIEVVTSDGRVLPAQVVGSDPGTDVAVVQLTKAPAGLRVARLGNSDGVRVGDYVLAIGNPLGLGQTVTMGIVSAKNRSLGGELVDVADFIQTDAAINQGNSGGPLFNFNGEVVGINSAILNPAVAMNVGFAIPINLARGIAEQLQSSGRVGRGFLGVQTDPNPLTPEQARRLRVDVSEGAVVNAVTDGSPAAKAGVRPQDVIVEVAGRRIDSSVTLQQVIRARRPGESVSMTFLRGPVRKVVQVTLTENAALSGADVLGMRVQPLTGQEAQSLGLNDASGAVRVHAVNARGEVSGSLQEGDVVVAVTIGRKRGPASVDNIRAFEQHVKKGGRGQLVILRNGEPFALNF